jgi:hypothetical protein
MGMDNELLKRASELARKYLEAKSDGRLDDAEVILEELIKLLVGDES